MAFSEQYQDHETGSLMLDLHIEGAAPVTLLVRDESRSTRSTSMNKSFQDESLDLELIEAENNGIFRNNSDEILEDFEHPLSRQPTTSIDETDTTHTTTELRFVSEPFIWESYVIIRHLAEQ